MSQVRKGLVLLSLIAVYLIVATGCGQPNPYASFDQDKASEGHAANWLPSKHADAASDNMDHCEECHGDDFYGGISGVACFDCHLGSEDSVHPETWADLAYARHGDYTETAGNSSCAIASCHGNNLDGIAASGPSCTSCHMGGVASFHPDSWGDFAYALHGMEVELNGADTCSNSACHGAELDGVTESGPSCTSCHMDGLNSIHPLEWDDDILLHEDYVGNNGTTSCRNTACHGAMLEGVVSSGLACNACHSSF